MDPVTLMTAIGFGSQLIGGMSATRNQSQALEAEAQAATNNALSAKLKAQADAQTQVIQARAVINRQTSEFAASNLEGASVFAVLADSTANAEMDRLNIIFNGKVRADAYTAEANAKMDAQGNIRDAGLFGILGTGFSGASSILKM